MSGLLGGIFFFGTIHYGLIAMALLGSAVLFPTLIWLSRASNGVLSRHGKLRKPLELEFKLGGKAHVLDQLLHSSRHGYWFLDRNDISTEVNSAMCMLLNRTRHEIVGRSPLAFFGGCDLEIMRLELSRSGRDELGEFEVTITHPDGVVVQCLVCTTPIRDERGDLMGSAGLWMDLRARRNAIQTARGLGMP